MQPPPGLLNRRQPQHNSSERTQQFQPDMRRITTKRRRCFSAAKKKLNGRFFVMTSPQPERLGSFSLSSAGENLSQPLRPKHRSGFNDLCHKNPNDRLITLKSRGLCEGAAVWPRLEESLRRRSSSWRHQLDRTCVAFILSTRGCFLIVVAELKGSSAGCSADTTQYRQRMSSHHLLRILLG